MRSNDPLSVIGTNSKGGAYFTAGFDWSEPVSLWKHFPCVNSQGRVVGITNPPWSMHEQPR